VPSARNASPANLSPVSPTKVATPVDGTIVTNNRVEDSTTLSKAQNVPVVGSVARPVPPMTVKVDKVIVALEIMLPSTVLILWIS